MSADDLPTVNALLNSASAVLLVAGYAGIRARKIAFHKACMLTALALSTAFLASYLYYHIVHKHGQSTEFKTQAPDAPAWVAKFYYTMLTSHILLAVPTAFMALYVAYLGLRNRLDRHIKLARWTLAVWLYVSVTGVAVYWMLYRLYAPD